MISESIAAMKPGRVLIGAEEWLGGAGIDGDIRAAEFNCIKSIARRLRNGDIAGDGRNRHDPDVGRAQRHDERDGIIGSGVGIDKESSRHAARIANYSGGGSRSRRLDGRDTLRSTG